MQIRVGNRFGASSHLLALLPAGSEVEHLLWSQSDRSIIYDTSHPNNDHELYAIQSDGSGLRALTDDSIDELDPAWSPDGSMLVYTSAPYAGLACKGCALTLRIARADGTYSRALTRHGSGVYDSGAAWSPDGSKIAFVRATSDTPARLYTVNPDGSDLAPLASGTRAAAPAWSPDGTMLAFVSSAPSSGGILAADVAGGAVHTEVPTPAGERASDLHNPEWSPDGSMIAFTGRHGVYLDTRGKRGEADRDRRRGRASVLVARRHGARLRRAVHELHDVCRPGARSQHLRGRHRRIRPHPAHQRPGGRLDPGLAARARLGVGDRRKRATAGR